jgi:Amt family ammonium transporter
MLLGALTGLLSWPLELAVMAATIALLNIPVRYRFTTRGVALGRVVFRNWSEFSGYRASNKGVLLAGKPGNGGFRFRVRGKERADLVKRQLQSRLPAMSERRATAATGGFKRLRYALMLTPIVAIVLALGVTAAFADGPDVDPSGTTVGTATDLGCIGVGGGQGFACPDADGNPDPAFAKAQNDEPFAYNLAGYVNQNRLAINFVWVLVTGYLVMFMQAGFAMVETGFCRAKSAMHVMMTNFMIYGIGMTAYWAASA